MHRTLFDVHPEQAGFSGRYLNDWGRPHGWWDSDAGPVTKMNVFKRAGSASMFMRRSAIESWGALTRRSGLALRRPGKAERISTTLRARFRRVYRCTIAPAWTFSTMILRLPTRARCNARTAPRAQPAGSCVFTNFHFGTLHTGPRVRSHSCCVSYKIRADRGAISLGIVSRQARRMARAAACCAEDADCGQINITRGPRCGS